MYAPTSDYSDEQVEKHYDQIDEMLKHCKSTEVVIVIGDWNAKVEEGKDGKIVVQYGLGHRNERGDRLDSVL